MKTAGKDFKIFFDGEEIGSMTEVNIDDLCGESFPIPEVITCTVQIEFWNEAKDYFMKALMYAITYKN